jgi:hypothetical protein
VSTLTLSVESSIHDNSPNKKTTKKTVAFLFGGDEEDRTLDLRIANATLSQLSYIPVSDQ